MKPALHVFALAAGLMALVTAVRVVPGRIAGAAPMALAAAELDAGPLPSAAAPGLITPDLDSPPNPDGPALAAIAADQADPTANPGGFFERLLALVEEKNYGKAAALLVAGIAIPIGRRRKQIAARFRWLDGWWFDPAVHLLVALGGGLAHYAIATTAPGWRFVLTGVILACLSYITTMIGSTVKRALGGAPAADDRLGRL